MCWSTRPIYRPHHDWKALFPALSPDDPREARRPPPGSTTSKSRIKVERWLTPQDIHDRYHVLDGAIYGLASHGRFNGAFKPANRSPDARQALPGRRRRASRPGHAHGHDVGLDRRRLRSITTASWTVFVNRFASSGRSRTRPTFSNLHFQPEKSSSLWRRLPV